MCAGPIFLILVTTQRQLLQHIAAAPKQYFEGRSRIQETGKHNENQFVVQTFNHDVKLRRRCSYHFVTDL